MQKLYHGLSRLEISFQCCLSIDRLATLSLEKALRRQVGTRGFAYSVDTGIDGATWHIADSGNPEYWNVSVMAKSLMLEKFGYFETKNKILEFLTGELMAIFPGNNNTPLERIRRVDYCADFLAENFTPNINNIFRPNRTKRNYGNAISGICLGKMPNRQIAIYNKSDDIWRVEARVGKKELNKYNIRRFPDFEKNAGNIIISILNDYRYLIPQENKPRSHWPLADFWKITIKSANEYFAEFSI